MKFKNVIVISMVVATAYFAGKGAGAEWGIGETLTKYKVFIPDDELTLNMIDRGGFKVTVTGKAKGV